MYSLLIIICDVLWAVRNTFRCLDHRVNILEILCGIKFFFLNLTNMNDFFAFIKKYIFFAPTFLKSNMNNLFYFIYRYKQKCTIYY